MSHYHPQEGQWSHADVEKYKRWYFSWINYIEKKCPRLRTRAKIFEIGSAVGSVAHLLYERGHDVTGSDISGLMVKTAQALCRPIPFVHCDVQKNIPGTKRYDAVLGFEVLEHVYDLPRALANIRKSLLPGGYFIGTSPYPYKKNYLDRTHVNVMYPEDWKRMFMNAGFRMVQVTPMAFFPFFWRLGKYANPVLPFYIPWPFFVSTALIIAQK